MLRKRFAGQPGHSLVSRKKKSFCFFFTPFRRILNSCRVFYLSRTWPFPHEKSLSSWDPLLGILGSLQFKIPAISFHSKKLLHELKKQTNKKHHRHPHKTGRQRQCPPHYLRAFIMEVLRLNSEVVTLAKCFHLLRAALPPVGSIKPANFNPLSNSANMYRYFCKWKTLPGLRRNSVGVNVLTAFRPARLTLLDL